jgi:hypothetical protein
MLQLPLLFLLCLSIHTCLGIPLRDRDQQSLLRPQYGESRAPPFTPGHRDPFDKKIDSIGKKLQPLPFRNGHGATVMGPRNKDRERQNPDMVRPPSTDHGNIANMRWSFADSHVRIEVGHSPCIRCLS